MNASFHFDFYSNNRTLPQIDSLIEFSDGCIHFDGYYYMLDEDLPIRIYMTIKKNTIYKSNIVCQDVKDKFYEIEIYNIVIIKNNHKFTEIKKRDGSVLKICFSPKSEQKIYFRIIKEFNTITEMLKNISR